MILTQGPKSNTIEDFWIMVEQYKSNRIIMLTKLEEDSVEKCVNYWAPQNQMDKFKLELLSEEHIKFKSIINNYPITFYSMAWLGIPVSILTYEEIEYMINESEKIKNNLPIIIHCGGGVGSTVTFASIYLLYKEIIEQINIKYLNNIRFSVFNMVRKLKEIRLYSVETLKQY